MTLQLYNPILLQGLLQCPFALETQSLKCWFVRRCFRLQNTCFIMQGQYHHSGGAKCLYPPLCHHCQQLKHSRRSFVHHQDIDQYQRRWLHVVQAGLRPSKPSCPITWHLPNYLALAQLLGKDPRDVPNTIVCI
jgi:hypothetical protein